MCIRDRYNIINSQSFQICIGKSGKGGENEHVSDKLKLWLLDRGCKQLSLIHISTVKGTVDVGGVAGQTNSSATLTAC